VSTWIIRDGVQSEIEGNGEPDSRPSHGSSFASIEEQVPYS